MQINIFFLISHILLVLIRSASLLHIIPYYMLEFHGCVNIFGTVGIDG